MTQAFNMDCLDYMGELNDNAFDLAIVDPQYGIGMSMKNRTHTAVVQDNGRVLHVPERSYAPKDWDKHRPSEEYFMELFRVSKNQIIWGGNYFTEFLPPSMGWIVWDKINPGTNYSDCELAFTSFHRALRKVEYMWNGMLQGKSIKNGSTSQGDNSLKEKRIHPTQKPIKLYRWILENYAKEGWSILDTHLGSGSSRIAAADMGFEFVGCEIDEDYFLAQQERFEASQKQQKLF